MMILIVGGGWSGLAAAIRLIDNGHDVHLIEAAPQLGGRARTVAWQGIPVDNGQHLMIGAYRHMLGLLEHIGVDTHQVFARSPVNLSIHDPNYPTLTLSAKGKLPWPLSVAASLSRSAGISALFAMRRIQKQIPMRLQSQQDISVADWLQQTKQPARLIHQLWEPLCLATLNTPINDASAQLFARVLQDSLMQGEKAADLLIPTLPLGDILPLPTSQYLDQKGATTSLKTRVAKLDIQQGKIHGVQTHDGHIIEAEHVIVATCPTHLSNLLSPHIDLPTPDTLPISTIYLQYPAASRLGQPMLGMTGTHSQWIFDRSQQHPGLMAIVISGPGEHETLNKAALINIVSQEVHQLFPHLPAQAQSGFIIREKRATFASTVGIQQHRPSHKTNIEGLWLAGDFVSNNYPATLEGAIISGQACAQQLTNI